MRAEDKNIVSMFDDLRRSTAVMTLALWHRNGLLSKQELSEFTAETQATIEAMCKY